MNPRSAASSDGSQSPLPVHTHELTPQETLELGEIAIEEPHDVAPTSVPNTTPLPPTTVVSPQAPILGANAPAAPSAQPTATAPIPANEPVPAAPVTAAPPVQPVQASSDQGASVSTPHVTPAPASGATGSEHSVATPSKQDAPLSPQVIAPKTTPSKAPDIAAPAPKPTVDPAALGATDTQPAQVSTADRMELSANTMNLKSISRLHMIGVAMNVLVIVLIIGVVAGGWYVYKYVLGGNGIQL